MITVNVRACVVCVCMYACKDDFRNKMTMVSVRACDMCMCAWMCSSESLMLNILSQLSPRVDGATDLISLGRGTYPNLRTYLSFKN